MRFLKWIFRHRYKIVLVRDGITPEGRYVVRELSWHSFIFPVYMYVDHSNTLQGAMDIIEEHKNRKPESETIYRN